MGQGIAGVALVEAETGLDVEELGLGCGFEGWEFCEGGGDRTFCLIPLAELLVAEGEITEAEGGDRWVGIVGGLGKQFCSLGEVARFVGGAGGAIGGFWAGVVGFCVMVMRTAMVNARRMSLGFIGVNG
ncbi:MAG: hypothetical protein HC860_19255 [Alkalinema sp. RU_4_3]|nr:hypothetical protein [Alkalinema sp. RU_4_3]